MRSWTTVMAGALAVALVGGFCLAQRPGGAGPEERGPGQRLAPPLIRALDGNGDGAISAEELASAAANLKKLDQDGDGQLSRDEAGLRRRPFGGPGGPGGSRPPRPGGATTAFESAPIPKDDAEKKILDVLDDLDRNQRRGMMNVPKEDGRLLRLLAESIGAKHVVEIGTSNGYSGIWLCLALRNTGGKLSTLEIDQRRAGLARENFKRAGVDSLVTLVEGDAHKEVAAVKGPIDLVFLDADKEGYVDYLEKLLPRVRPGGLIVAHNMNTRQADPRYVKAITTNKDLETLFLHMDHAGVAVSMKKY